MRELKWVFTLLAGYAPRTLNYDCITDLVKCLDSERLRQIASSSFNASEGLVRHQCHLTTVFVGGIDSKR